MHDIIDGEKTLRRSKTRAEARLLCYLIAQEKFEWSYPELAEAFGRHHTTIITGIRTAREKLAKAKPGSFMRQAYEQFFNDNAVIGDAMIEQKEKEEPECQNLSNQNLPHLRLLPSLR
jgi:hypothetical protein